ncbi:hypothetical protein [Flavobacterium sp. NRK1]|uniref:hypothetical protein n=1 Tax=Flavobacterium sp. NRK1 TaxID=2954929 RepID=UPI002092FA40|nr:hypothetical protein [Flavobacterium sp. NRK1]MCO6147497.1 hypothetical protein [Flavobacterium sp. NRK1]
MTITIKTQPIYNKNLLLLHLKNHLIKQGISTVSITDDKLVLENRFFNGQSRMNRFTYLKKGEISIQSSQEDSQLHFEYHNYKFSLYLCLLSAIIAYFWSPMLFMFYLLSFQFIVNIFIVHIRQKLFFSKAVKDFINNHQTTMI